MAALAAAARAVLIGLGVFQAGQTVGELAGVEAGGPGSFLSLGPGAGTGFKSATGFFRGHHRRHRRRKALTNDDVRIALIIASSISKKAAEVFIAQRVRPA